jgi:tetratricopeptide (TPR) repeat protein
MINKLTKQMKMKNLIVLVLLSVTTTFSFSQEQSECDKMRGFTSLYAQQKMYRDAANFFIKSYNICGIEGLQKVDWNNAKIIYKQLIKAEKVDKREQELSDTLIWIYKNGDTYENDPKWKSEYATYLVKIKSNDMALIDELYANSIHSLKENNKTYDLQMYYKHLVTKFSDAEGEEQEKARTIALDEYITLSDYLSKAKANEDNDKKKKRYQDAQEYLDNYFAQLAKDCEILVDVLSKKITDLPKDKAAKIEATKKYLDLLDKRSCTDTDLYGQFADTLLTLEPTAEAYYSQGNFYINKNDYNKAKEYIEKAIELEGEGENIGKYQYGLAYVYYKMGSYKSAVNVAKSVNGEYAGKALKLIGDAIAKTANSCGDTSFERKANFWLANDYYKKAAAAGESVSTSQYLSNAPTGEEIFDQGLSKGNSFTLTCWGESTTIR